MTLLDRYITRQFFSNLVLVLCSLISIYLLVDFFERIDDFVEKGKPFSLAVKYFVLKIPFIYDQMSPVCILLAGIVTLGLLNRNREMMSLNAGGISLLRITRPLLTASLLFTVLTLANAQWLLPGATSITNEIWYEEVHKKVPHGTVRDGRIFFRGEEGIYSFLRPNPTRNDFTNFKYVSWNSSYETALFLTAATASWIEEEGWHFTDGQLKTARTGGGYDIILFEELDRELPESPELFFIPEYRVSELSLSQLVRSAVSDYRQGEIQGMVDANRRFSFIFLGIPLLILSIPLMLAMHRRFKRDLTMAVPVSASIAFCAWAAWSAVQSLGQAGIVNPFIASWTIHLLLAGGGFLPLWKMNR